GQPASAAGALHNRPDHFRTEPVWRNSRRLETGSAFITPLPNRICDGRSSQLSGNVRNNGFLWFDTACFLVPPVGYFGNSGPTVISGPGINNWNIGVEKSFVLAQEATRLQFRAELFNAWNHAQFDQPNGNAGAGTNFGRI